MPFHWPNKLENWPEGWRIYWLFMGLVDVCIRSFAGFYDMFWLSGTWLICRIRVSAVILQYFLAFEGLR